MPTVTNVRPAILLSLIDIAPPLAEVGGSSEIAGRVLEDALGRQAKNI
jgi:hypothetical protein